MYHTGTPVVVEYKLTEYSDTLHEVLTALGNWGAMHAKKSGQKGDFGLISKIYELQSYKFRSHKSYLQNHKLRIAFLLCISDFPDRIGFVICQQQRTVGQLHNANRPSADFIFFGIHDKAS